MPKRERFLAQAGHRSRYYDSLLNRVQLHQESGFRASIKFNVRLESSFDWRFDEPFKLYVEMFLKSYAEERKSSRNYYVFNILVVRINLKKHLKNFIKS